MKCPLSLDAGVMVFQFCFLCPLPHPIINWICCHGILSVYVIFETRQVEQANRRFPLVFQYGIYFQIYVHILSSIWRKPQAETIKLSGIWHLGFSLNEN